LYFGHRVFELICIVDLPNIWQSDEHCLCAFIAFIYLFVELYYFGDRGFELISISDLLSI